MYATGPADTTTAGPTPPASLLLQKPLAESAGGVVHGGGDKFADVNDPAYIDFLAWIQREAACAP